MRKGRRLVGVTINAPDDWNDHRIMLDAGFENYAPVKVVSKGEQLGYLEVAGGQCGYVELIAGEDFLYSLSKDEDLSIVYVEPGFVYAPTVKGTIAGVVYICVDGKPVGKCSIIFGETIEQIPSKKKSFWKKLLGVD